MGANDVKSSVFAIKNILKMIYDRRQMNIEVLQVFVFTLTVF